MPRINYRTIAVFSIFTAASLLGPMTAQAFGPSRLDQSGSAIVRVKQAKCAAGTVESYEGTDMSGITDKCQAIFDACINEKLPCATRLAKCKTFDKMDGDGSCYKKKR